MLKYYIKKYIKSLGPSGPYVSANERLQCIFIHIPKCAGISIEESLFGEKIGHKNYIDYKIYDAERCRRYLKFTVVREPIDRFQSAFRFLKAGGRNAVDQAWSDRVLSEFETLEELVCEMQSNSKVTAQVLSWQHFRPQYTFLINERGQIEMDHILRFGRLATDFKQLADILGVSGELKHSNKTASSGMSTNVLSDEACAFLKQQYEEDYKRLGQYFEVRGMC